MDTAQALTTMLARSSRLYKMRVNATLTSLNIDLSSEMCGILLELGKKEGQNQQELSRLLYKDKGGITKLLKSLGKRELIYARENEKDKRYKNIFLTPKGKQTLQKVMPVIQELRAQTLKGISEKEKIHTQQLLLKLISNLSEESFL